MFTRGYVSSGSRKTLQNQYENQWNSFCHRSLWVHLWIIAVASGAVRTALGQIQLRLRSVCGWPYWLFGEHFWGRAEEAVLTFWQLGSWPAESIKWIQALFQMLSDIERIFRNGLYHLWTNWEWFMIVLPHYSCADQAVSGSTCSRMFQGRHSGEIEFIDLHRDPYTNKCKVRHQQNMQWNNAAILSEISINQSRHSFRARVEPHSMGDLQDPIYGGT